MGGGRSASTSDARSTTSSSSKTSRRKTDSKSASSRKSSRGDDRDRGLGDLSAYPPSTSGSRRGPPSIAGESVASTYVTAEPDAIDYTDRTVVERTPKRRDSDRESKSSRRRERDRSESRERERRRSSRRSGDDTYDDDLDRDRERDRRDRSRTYSGDHYVPPISTAMPSSAPGAQFAADIAAPGFSQFPMQYDNAIQPPVTTAPGHSPSHDASPTAFDPHIQQQFPGQFPSGTAQPYFPPNNPAGAAADYYGDQGQSVNDQPGVRPQQPAIIPNSQAHLMAASPSANPPPEPSSLGQVGAAAAYFTDDIPHTESQAKPPTGSSSKPPKPGKPSRPSQPSSSSAIPAAAAAAAVTYGVGNYEESQAAAAYQHESYSSTTVQQTHSYSQPALTSTSKPPHSHGIGTGIGMAAAGAAAGYMVGHQHHTSSPTHSSQYTFQNYEQSSHGSVPPYGAGPNNAMIAAGAAGAAGVAGYAAHAAHNPGFYPHGGLAVQHRHRGPLTKFVDFWRDPEGVGRFEDYTETIGVCKYCFEPGSTSMNAPRKHHYHARRHSADRYSSGSSSRITKLSRYHSSEDERRSRKRSSKKSSSWLPGMLAGYAAKSIFTGKDFDDSYSVRSGHASGERVSTYDREDDRRSYTSRGVVRRSGRSSPREYHSDSKHTRRTRSRSRSSSRSGHHSFVKEAALGAAVGGAALAVAKSSRRSRSRSPSRVHRRKDSSSSTSFVDVSRPSAKSVGGFTSFFTSSSENRKKEKKKQRSKKSRGFFSFNSSSTSSLDADLAFGSGFAKKSSKLQKKKKSKKNEDVDAALIGLGATATALAASSQFRSGRSTGQMMTARDTRHTNYTSSATNDDEWIDAESEDQSSSSVSSALAFGASSAESSSDSNSSGGWKWGWGNKKKKKDRKSSKMDTALAAGAGALGGAAIASVARRRDSRPPSEAGSLQQVYPVPTSDPSRFDVAKMSPSVVSGGQPPLVRPGPIPLQQPQPYTPVSQAVYTTQGTLPGAIPAYSPGAVPPIFANEYDQYNMPQQGSRDAAYVREDASFIERRKPHRSDSSPVFPTQESVVSAPKRRYTTRDQASVSFDLTEEQAERERRLDRRDRKSRDDIRDAPVQLIDHEEELAREEAERRERRERRKYREEEKRRSDSDKEKDYSSLVEAAAIGAIGAAAASSFVSSRKSHEEDASETSSRHRDRRAERRAERRGDSSVISKSDISEPIEEKVSSVSRDSRDKPTSQKSPRPAPVYEDYAEFFAPEEVRHSPDQHSRDQDRSRDSGEPQIVEVVPASEREKNNDEPRDDLPQFAQEPYEGRDHLPWPVPRLNFIDPTPPQSVNGSVRGNSPLVTPVEPVREEVEPKERERQQESQPEPEPEPERERERPSTGSRVSWGPHQTHEYEIPSSSEQDPHSPIEEITRDVSMTELEKDQSKDVHEKIDFGNDIEFAAIAAAGAQAAGFDPSVVINDPSYHTRTSPPGSEDEGTFSPRSKWAVPPQPDQPHGFVEGEIDSYAPSKSRDIELPVEHVIEEKPFYAEPETFTKDKDDSSFQRRDRGSIAQEVIEQLNGRSPRSTSPDNDVFSMPGGFESADVSRDDVRSVFSAPPERESEKSKSKKSRRSGDDFEFPREVSSRERDVASLPEEVEENAEEKSTHRKHRSKHGDNDSFPVDDDARSAITSVEGVEKSERRKHRHRSSRDKDFDDAASIASSPAAASYEDGEKSERRKRRSKRESDTFSVDDDARSAITSIDDTEKSERRKHRHRSSRDRDFDDNVSVTSSPARIDETREKRRSKDGKDEKEKDKSGSILRSIFGSRVSAPEGRTRSNQSSRSSSLEKRPSRDAVSEAGVDDERRRRKKRSSRHRSSSGGDKLDDDASDKEGSVRDDTNLEEYRSQRQQKEERRRHRYEEIVESGKRRESEKV